MAIIHVKCINCDKIINLRLNLSKEIAFCPNCGMKFLEPESSEQVIKRPNDNISNDDLRYSELISEARLYQKKEDLSKACELFEAATKIYPKCFEPWYELLCIDLLKIQNSNPIHCISSTYNSVYLSNAQECANETERALITEKMWGFTQFVSKHNSKYDEMLFPIRQTFKSMKDVYDYLRSNDLYLKCNYENDLSREFIITVSKNLRLSMYKLSGNYAYDKKDLLNYEENTCELTFEDGIRIYLTYKISGPEFYCDSYFGLMSYPEDANERKINIYTVPNARKELKNVIS